MKLELKHLAAYFFYELEYKNNYNDTCKLVNIQNINDGSNVNLTGFHGGLSISEIKPILRSLDDLFFNLSIENESQKPFEYLEDFADTEIERMFLDIIENKNSKFILEKIQYAPFSFIQKLLEWHFDIFGLIDAKLAVDINCL